MAFHGFGAREMGGLVPAKVKRRDLEEVYDEFSEFSLSAPPKKIRRLEAELPPIMEEDEILTSPSSEEFLRDAPTSSSSSTTHPNEERALVLYKPVSDLPLTFDSPRPPTITIDASLMASLKNQSLEPGRRVQEGASSDNLALVPWTPRSQTLDAAILEERDGQEEDAMESEDVVSSVMDMEAGSEGLQQRHHHCLSSQMGSRESTHDAMSSWG